ncbi:cyclic AMP-dependent transcription factor ATF-2-like [Mya arenaria]|uniref:cyclic AMP-dependent transcription factor ATF-2-like n=1 Tax=Mya arenaria TaxID=6604 RepID=UPI0022E09FC1|nr:cyclic AMP-dependent transcription factor ATF-2-like [Mya arenaria]
MADDDKPFLCSERGCGMRFTNEDHLSVHMRKHDLQLALQLNHGGLSPGLFTDQTPTPTKFLRNCEELGLFQELAQKNPFDDSFKKAMDDPPTSQSHDSHPHSVAETETLDTPQPPLPKILIGDNEIPETAAETDTPVNLTGSHIIPKKRKKYMTQSSIPTSTTSEDEEESVIGSSSVHLIASQSASSSTYQEMINSQSNPSSVNQNIIGSHSYQKTAGSEPNQSPAYQEMIDSQATNQMETETTGNVPTSKPQTGSTAEGFMEEAGVGIAISTVPVQIIGGNSPTIVSSPAAVSIATSTVISPKLSQPVQTTPTSPGFVTVLFQLPNGQIIPMSVPANSQIAQSTPGTPVGLPQVGVKPDSVTQGFTMLAGSMTGNNPPSVIQTNAGSQTPTMASPQGGGGGVVFFQPRPTTPNLTTHIIKQETPQFLTGLPYTHQTGTQVVLVGGTQSPSVMTIQAGNHSTPLRNLKASTITSPDSNTASNQSYAKQRLKAAIQQQATPTHLGSRGQGRRAEPASVDMVSSSSGPSDEPRIPSGLRFQDISEQGDGGEDDDLKRNKFLERNRAAAARCRQKRKVWVESLEKKTDEMNNLNARLNKDIMGLRAEVAQLKTLLLAHKDCAVTQQQRAMGQIRFSDEPIGATDDAVAPEEHQPTLPQQLDQSISAMTSLPVFQAMENQSKTKSMMSFPVLNSVLNQSATTTTATQPVFSMPVLQRHGAQSITASSGEKLIAVPVNNEDGAVDVKPLTGPPLSVITGPNSLSVMSQILNLANQAATSSS